jgi:hypothetical protein
MVGFVNGIGFCMSESRYDKCFDCETMQECQQMLTDDVEKAKLTVDFKNVTVDLDDLSLNPKTKGSTLADEIYDHNHEARPWPVGPMKKRESYITATDLSMSHPVTYRAPEELKVGAEIEEISSDDKDDGVLRSFESGATRDTGGNKLVYDKFLSPGVIKQFAKYMNMNRLQSDGKLRAGDNWQKGIPMDVYEESEGRHHHEAWEFFRQINHRDRDGMVEGVGAMCGILFNVMGWLHEWLKANPMVDFDGDEPTFEMKERQDGLKDDAKTESA